MIKAVFIDIDNTLLDFGACAKKAMQKTMEQHGLEYSDRVFEVFDTINGSLWAQIELGKLTREGLRLVRWNKIFGVLGIDFDGVLFEDGFSANLWESAEKIPYAEQLLKYLHEKYTVCAASNGGQEQQEHRLTIAGLIGYIDRVFTSELIGYSKPSKEFFDGCFARLPRIEKSEVMLIGDSLQADISGALDYGLANCWFDYSGKGVCGGIVPDRTVRSLEEIKNII